MTMMIMMTTTMKFNLEKKHESERERDFVYMLDIKEEIEIFMN